MPVLAQASDWNVLLDKFPAGDLVGLFAIFVVFSTILMIVITVSVTRMVSSIRIASIDAKLAEKLAAQGMSASEIEAIVKTSASRGRSFHWPRRWQRAEPATGPMPGKPPRFHTA